MLATVASPFPIPFFGFIDSKGHSRFVLPNFDFTVSLATRMTMGLTTRRRHDHTGSTVSHLDQAMETGETHYFAERGRGSGLRPAAESALSTTWKATVNKICRFGVQPDVLPAFG